MRVLLVTWSDQLLQKLQILSPQLEYCAIVVDELEPAQKILERVKLPKSLLHPLYELKECVRDFYYDYVICIEDGWWTKDLFNQAKRYGVPQDKLLLFNALTSGTNFLVERSLRYFKEHAADFEMFITGISLTAVGMDVTQFKRKCFNFGRTGQDLYYNFQVAKRAVTYGGGYGRLRYALITLPAYAFQYDNSKTFNSQFLMLQYLIAFNDLHNFFVPAEVYRSFFRKEFLSRQLPLDNFDTNNPHLEKSRTAYINRRERLESRGKIDTWAQRIFPDTRTEYIKILDDYLTLCEQNNIRPIILLMPATEGYIKHYDRQRLDEFQCIVRQACRKHPSAIFLDSWQITGLTDRDFYDVYHLNLQGAAKFCAWLNRLIEQLDGKQ